MNNEAAQFKAGDRVTFLHYGELHTGRVLRAGNGIVWVADDKGGPLFRERWLHAESVQRAPVAD